MKRIWLIFLSCMLILSCSIVCGCKQEDGLSTAELHEVTRSVFYAPQYVAVSKGFFEEEGLKINITTSGG